MISRVLFLVLATLLVAGCDKQSPASPTPPPTPVSSPVLSVRADPANISRSTVMHERPWVAYSSCGQVRNLSQQPLTITAEMVIFGADGRRYQSEKYNDLLSGQSSPGAGLSGCGLISARDFDTTHSQATQYQLRVSYLAADGTSGVVEAESSIHVTENDVRNIVINEFRSRGPSGDDDQFIELLNVSSTSVSIDGWFLQVSSDSLSAGPFERLYGNIKPGCYFLVAALTPPWHYTGKVAGDHPMSPILRDSIGLALRTTTGQVVDQVAMSNNTAYTEGTPLADFGTSNTDRSYARVGPDTGDNARDSRMTSPATPQNSQSGCR
jgi:hypothetical protein